MVFRLFASQIQPYRFQYGVPSFSLRRPGLRKLFYPFIFVIHYYFSDGVKVDESFIELVADCSCYH